MGSSARVGLRLRYIGVQIPLRMVGKRFLSDDPKAIRVFQSTALAGLMRSMVARLISVPHSGQVRRMTARVVMVPTSGFEMKMLKLPWDISIDWRKESSVLSPSTRANTSGTIG